MKKNPTNVTATTAAMAVRVAAARFCAGFDEKALLGSCVGEARTVLEGHRTLALAVEVWPGSRELIALIACPAADGRSSERTG